MHIATCCGIIDPGRVSFCCIRNDNLSTKRLSIIFYHFPFYCFGRCSFRPYSFLLSLCITEHLQKMGRFSPSALMELFLCPTKKIVIKFKTGLFGCGMISYIIEYQQQTLLLFLIINKADIPKYVILLSLLYCRLQLDSYIKACKVSK